MNKVFLSGNLTRDVEVRYSQSGKAFAKMGIAVSRRTKEKESVDFFNMTAFDKTAEFCGKYLRKGSRVLVEGRLQTSTYENRDGVKVSAVDIMIDNIEFANSKASDEGGNDYSRPANNNGGYSNNRDSGGYSKRDTAPPKSKNDYDFGGEIIDPDDTPF